MCTGWWSKLGEKNTRRPMANDRSPWPSVRFESGLHACENGGQINTSTQAGAVVATGCMRLSTCRRRRSTPCKCTSLLVTAQINNRHISPKQQQQTLVFVWRGPDCLGVGCEWNVFLQGPDNMHHITTRKKMFCPLLRIVDNAARGWGEGKIL